MPATPLSFHRFDRLEVITLKQVNHHVYDYTLPQFPFHFAKRLVLVETESVSRSAFVTLQHSQTCKAK